MPEASEKVKAKDEEVAVRVIEYRGKAAVVQAMDGGTLRRYVVDNSKVRDGKVAAGVLKRSPEVGEKWAEKVELKGTPEDLERIMRERGLFTVEDLNRDPGILHGAFLEFHHADIVALRKKEG